MKNMPHFLWEELQRLWLQGRVKNCCPFVQSIYAEHKVWVAQNWSSLYLSTWTIRWQLDGRSSPLSRAGSNQEQMVVVSGAHDCREKKWRGIQTEIPQWDPNSQVLWSQSHLSLWGEKLETLHNRTHECELNWLPVIKTQEILHENLHIWLLLKIRIWQASVWAEGLAPLLDLSDWCVLPSAHFLAHSPLLSFSWLAFSPKHLTLQPLDQNSSRFLIDGAFRKQNQILHYIVFLFSYNE